MPSNVVNLQYHLQTVEKLEAENKQLLEELERNWSRELRLEDVLLIRDRQLAKTQAEVERLRTFTQIVVSLNPDGELGLAAFWHLHGMAVRALEAP